MYNDLFSIGPLTFHTYGLMTGIGIVAAYLAAERLAKKRSLDFEQIFGLVISCLIFGYAGSKLLYILTVLPQLIANPGMLRDILSTGWVVFGGLLGGIFGLKHRSIQISERILPLEIMCSLMPAASFRIREAYT